MWGGHPWLQAGVRAGFFAFRREKKAGQETALPPRMPPTKQHSRNIGQSF